MNNEIVNTGTIENRIGMKDRFATWFLIVSLISGLLIIFFTPPMCSPDENAHYMNAYGVSRGDLFPEVVNGIPGRYVEGRVYSFLQKYNGRFAGNLSEKYSFSEQYFDSYLDDPNDEPVFYGNELNTINPIAYIPSGLAMAAGRLFCFFASENLGHLPYNLLLCGRLGNLLFSAFVTYYALLKAKCFRRLSLLVMMMPVTMFLCASVNYDAILIPVSFLLITKVCNLVTEPSDKMLTRNDLWCILFCTFFLVGIKQIYTTLLIILLAVPKKKYGSTKKMIGYIVAVCAVALIAYTPNLINNIICKDIDRTAPYVKEQAAYVQSHLSQMPQIFINTIQMFKAFYKSSFFGKIGQLDSNIPLPFDALFYLLLFIVSIYEVVSTKLWDHQWKRVLPFAAVLISIIGMFVYMYIIWTPIPGVADGVGSGYISGIQGRYFIELFIPLISIFCFGRLSENRAIRSMGKVLDRIIIAWTAVCGLITPIIVFTRYW